MTSISPAVMNVGHPERPCQYFARRFSAGAGSLGRPLDSSPAWSHSRRAAGSSSRSSRRSATSRSPRPGGPAARYADIRFTRNLNDSVAVRDRLVTDSLASADAGADESAGFGVRVIHGGVWGFASGPLVLEDRIRNITRAAVDVARASAVARRADVKLVPVPAVPSRTGRRQSCENPFTVPLQERSTCCSRSPTPCSGTSRSCAPKRTCRSITNGSIWRSSEGSYIEQEVWRTARRSPRPRAERQGEDAHVQRAAEDGRLRGRGRTGSHARACPRIATEAVEHSMAPRSAPG